MMISETDTSPMPAEIDQYTQLSPYETELVINTVNGDSLYDGIISAQSLRLKEQFNASGFDMTILWVLTPQNWTCPSCSRTKPQIVRLNKKNELSCWIVGHHDHMKELLKKEFFDISTSMSEVVADQDAEGFAKRSSSMISSFDNVAICGDCNNADAKAKVLVSAHPSFTFSPSEILEFVIQKPNAPHVIDEDKANRIWENSKETFNLRLKIAKRIAHYAATQQHWYQKVPLEQRVEYFYSSGDRLPQVVREILTGPKRKQHGKALSEWRINSKFEKVETPTQSIIDHVRGVYAKKWSRQDEGWHCPVCQRNKSQQIRKNNKEEWSILFRESYFWNEYSPFCKEKVFVCNDCKLAGENLAKEALFSLGFEKLDKAYTSLLTTEEVSQFIIAKANARHKYDNDKAEQVLDIVMERIQSLGASCSRLIAR